MNHYLLAMLTLCCGFMVSCSDDDDSPSQGFELPTPTLRFSESIDSYNGSDIPVLTENADTIYYRYSLPQGAYDEINPAAVWHKTAINVETDSTVIHIDLEINMEKRVRYVMEAYASITKDKQSKKSEIVSKSFQSVRAHLIEVNNIQAGPAAVMFNADILEVEGKAGGYYYMIYSEGEYKKADFVASSEYAEVITVSGVQKQAYNISPNNTYILAVAPVKVGTNDWGGTYITEVFEDDITTTNFTTIPYVLNTIDATVGVEVASGNYHSITMNVICGANASGFYYGAIKTNLMNGVNIEDYLTKNSWFSTHATSNFSSFTDFNGDKQTNVTSCIADLSASTEYTVFAVAADIIGTPGKVTSATYTTPALTFNSRASVEVTIVSAEYQSVELSCNFLNGCTKAAYAYRLKDSTTDEEGKELVLANAEEDYYCFKGDNVTLENLDIGDYDLFVLPIDDNGQFGAVQKFAFSTKKVLFTGSAKASATITSTEKGNYGNIYHISITKGANCDKYLYGYTYSMGDQSDIEYATTVLMNTYSLMESSKVTTEYILDAWGDATKFVVIPVDASGNNGTPVILDCPGNVVTKSVVAKRRK